MIRSLLSFGVLEAAARGFNWLVLVTLPFFLSSDQYGIVGLIVAAESLGLTVALIGQDRSVLRFLKDESITRTELLGSITWILLVSAAVLLVVVVTLQLAGVVSLAGIPVWPHLWVLLLLVYGLMIVQVNCSLARGTAQPGTFFVNRVVVSFAKLVLVLGLAYALGSSLSYPVGAAVAVVIIGVASAAGLGTFNLAGSGRVARALLRFGWPFVFHAVAGGLLVAADRFLIAAYLDESRVGAYTFAYSVGASLSFVYGSLVVYMEPQIYGASADGARTRQWTNLFVSACLFGGIGVGLLLVGVVLPLAAARLGGDYAVATELVPIIVAAHWIIPLYLVGVYQLTIEKRTSLIAASSAAAAVLNIVLNVLWIPTKGLYGAALATFLSYLCLAVVIGFLSGRTFFDRARALQWASLAVVCTVMVLTGASAATYAVGVAVVVLLGVGLYRTYTAHEWE